MPIRQTKMQSFYEIFKPDNETGESEWIKREYLIGTVLEIGKNGGGMRQNIFQSISTHKWDTERLYNNPRGKILALKTIGFSEDKLQNRPIGKKIRDQFDLKNLTCSHCGNHNNLCIDHKNDMYNNKLVLSIETQELKDFQILCNKCNIDKHQANVLEEKTGIVYSVKKLRLAALQSDNFDYPWEKCVKYDKEDEKCKDYAYWYDIKAFYYRRELFKMYIRPLNAVIVRRLDIE